MNRTTIILFILLFAAAFETFSNPVDTETAKRAARNFMNIRRNTSNTVSDVVIEKREGQNAIYVVNFREGGRVMVSVDDAAVPVIEVLKNEIDKIKNDE